MANKIYVGNLPYTFSSPDLQELFAPFGKVVSAEVMMDRETGRSRGFGFVTMTSDDAAQAAIRALNGYSLEGRSLVVNEAREQGGGGGRRPGGYGGGGGGYGGGGGGGYGGGGGGGYGRGGGGGGSGGGGYGDRDREGGGGGNRGGYGGQRRARQFGQ